VAAALLGGLWIGRDSADVADQIASLPPGRQVAFTLSTLALLLGFSLFAAQFGLVGLAVFWLAVILIVA
jgi:hypothetical protein